MEPRIFNSLAEARARRGLTQAEAAALGGISRQSYSAIESGNSVPSTEVALRLAAGFGVALEALFRLPEPGRARVVARWAGGGAVPLGGRVRLLSISGDSVAHETGFAERPLRAADGIVVGVARPGWAEIELFASRPPALELLVVGCDPAFGLVSEQLSRGEGVEVGWRRLGSVAALEALARGEAHVAGAHLWDRETGEFNRPWIEHVVPFPCTRIVFAYWEQGLLVRGGNPLGISGVADLSRTELRFLNREPGSGSRLLLDEHLSRAGIPAERISGYSSGASGHLEVAEAIAAGLADVGVGIRAAASAFRLEHLPLGTERYELIIPNHFLDLPAMGRLLEVLRRPALRSQVEALDGYDASSMGHEVGGSR